MKTKFIYVENIRFLEFLLRLGVFMEFFGHGAFGIMTKAAWVPYVAIFGFSESTAWKLMPVIGYLDVFVLSLSALFFPIPALLLYMTFWGLFTAFLRPFTAEGVWEMVERTYNFGVPFSLFYFYKCTAKQFNYFGVNKPDTFRLNFREIKILIKIFKFVLIGMLIGHGAIGVFYEKKIYITLYKLLDVPESILESFKLYVGYFEILLGLLCVFIENIYFLFFILIWKVLSEGLYLVSPVIGRQFEFIERGGAYVAPLAMIFLMIYLKKLNQKKVV